MRTIRVGIALLSLAAACGGGGDSGGYGPITSPSGSGGSGGTQQPVRTTSVAVSNNQFSPATIQVSPGATVTWTWSQDAIFHNVTFATGASSQNLDANASFARAFPTAGTFTYQCTLHPGMTGTVVVQ